MNVNHSSCKSSSNIEGRMFRCNVPICSQLGIKSINVSNAKKLEDRFRVSDDGPPSARSQRVDPDVELEEATSQLSETKIE